MHNPDGSKSTAHPNDVINALRQQGYMILRMQPGATLEYYLPAWLVDAAEAAERERRRTCVL